MANEETVSIGCRLPTGIILEVGLQTTVKGGPSNRSIEQIKRLDNYARVHLGGTNQHSAPARKMGILMPSVVAPEPFITRNVSKALWEEWKRKHPGSWLLRSNNIFEVKDEKSIRAQIIDSMATPAPLAPMDPTKALTVGGDKVETAQFKD